MELGQDCCQLANAAGTLAYNPVSYIKGYWQKE